MASRRARIEFGTSGWRGIVGRDFTDEGARALVRAIGERIARRSPDGSVVVAHDTRPGGERLARDAAGVLEGLGLRPLVCAGATPTPVASFSVRRRRAEAGIVFTASHNPPDYHGLKWIAPDGGSAPAEETTPVARRANALLGRVNPPDELRLRPITPAAGYRRALLGRLDVEALSRARVVYDALHGCGAGWLDALLLEAGARVESLRATASPSFGRGTPDPRPERLGALRRRVRGGRGRRLGLATDGDADRFAVVDSSGAVLAEADALALLIDHLAEGGRLRRGLALSHVTGSLPERVARAHGIPVQRHPIGFKTLTRALAAGDVDVAGEESGGFAWAPLAHDKDGILAGALFAEIAGSGPDAVRARLARLREAHGPWRSGRTAVAAAAPSRRRLQRLFASPPQDFDGALVERAEASDGLRLGLEDGFVAWRASGTEPVLRIYAEAPGPRLLARRLGAARRVLEGR